MTKSATREAADKVTFTQTEVTSAVALKAPIASPVFTGIVQVGNGTGGAGGVKYPYGGSADTRNWRTRSDIAAYGDWGIEQSTTKTGETYATKLLINPAGIVTKPNQPAFMVLAGTATNLAVSTWHTLAFVSERFDNNDDFSSNTFTAPVTGKYQMNVFVRFHSLDNAGHYYFLSLQTSNNTYYHIHGANGWSNDPDYHTIGSSYVVDMDAGDTAMVKFYQASGSAQTDIQGGEGYFSGCLVA